MVHLMAKGVGFEPTDVLPSAVFRTAVISHSTNLSYCRVSPALPFIAYYVPTNAGGGAVKRQKPALFDVPLPVTLSNNRVARPVGRTIHQLPA